MSSWGNNDNAANAPYWAVNSTIVKNNPSGATPTSANVAKLYANTTANVYIQDITVGLFGVDAQESLATHAQHTGWTLRTTGSGGRAGRVTNEVLVALSTMSGDGDAQVYANVSITLSGPSNASALANATYFANTVSFSVTPTLAGNTAATLTYLWQYLNGATWTNLTANNTNIHYNGATTNTLYAMPGTTAASGTIYRCTVTAADQGVVAYSSNATITIT
jgi:hypothetical protein